jgi:K+-sensing histidine kinase KdpD
VSDEGPGIDSMLTEKIFDEFHSQEIARYSKGTALSLAISKILEIVLQCLLE